MTPAEVLPELAPVRAGEHLDWAALDAYLRAHIDVPTDEPEVLQFPNGGANLTYLLRWGEQSYVVRRPPFGTLAPGSHDMRREFRALSGLWPHFDRAPRSPLLCEDESVVGAPFLVLEYRAGEVIRDHAPASMAGLPDLGTRLGSAVVDALAELHLLDPAAVGLADLGRPEGFVLRQLAGWSARWQAVATDDVRPLMDAVEQRLAASPPATRRASILHNDYKLDNCQFLPGQPDRVSSIFDWDMATLGDPLVDLGTLLNYWPDPGDEEALTPVLHRGLATLGLPPRRVLVDRYSTATGIDVDDLHWYEAFACWKTAIALQQLQARHTRGETDDERLAGRGAAVRSQAQRALTILDGGRP